MLLKQAFFQPCGSVFCSRNLVVLAAILHKVWNAFYKFLLDTYENFSHKYMRIVSEAVISKETLCDEDNSGVSLSFELMHKKKKSVI